MNQGAVTGTMPLTNGNNGNNGNTPLTNLQAEAALVATAVAKMLTSSTSTSASTLAAAAAAPASGAGVAAPTAAVAPAVGSAVTTGKAEVTWSKHVDPESGRAYLVSSAGEHRWAQPDKVARAFRPKAVVTDGTYHVTSSYILCHIIIHTMSHHHT